MTRVRTSNASRCWNSHRPVEKIHRRSSLPKPNGGFTQASQDAQNAVLPRVALTTDHTNIENPDHPAYGVDVTKITGTPDRTDSITSGDGENNDSAMQLTEFDQQVLLSPTLNTPASSEVSSSFYDNAYIYDSEQYVRPPQKDSPSWSAFRDGQYASSPSQLTGIVETTLYDDTSNYAGSHVDLVSPEDPYPTYQQQRFPQALDPWSGHPLRQETSVTPSPLQDSMILDHNVEPSPNSSTGEKGGRRVGPLTQQQRERANAVRLKGACLRCAYMKETCDDNEDGCFNCKQKKGRKWKLGCVRRRLSEQIDYLFPAILRERYSRETVRFCTNNYAWWYLDRPEFILRLDLDIPGSMLEVPVKEVEVVDPSHQELHAWRTNTSGKLPVMEKTDVWAPPLVLYLTDKAEEKRRIFYQLSVCMHRVFSIKENDPIIKPKQSHWPWPCFDTDDNEWEALIVIAIFEYWRKDIPSHKVLGKAHTVLFFNYVLDHMWQVTDEGRTEMLRNLQNTQGYDPGKRISPDTVNCFLKSLIFDWTFECVRDILKELQDLLHGMALGKETSTAKSDMAFCLSFMMLVTLSQIQSRLLLLTTYTKREIGINLALDEADRLIEEMEREVATYIVHLHEFSLKRRKIIVASPNSFDAAERHAASFGLMNRVEDLTLRQFSASPNPSLPKFDTELSIVHQRPSRFKLPSRDIDRFDPVNTHRLCWKFVEAIGNRAHK